MTFSISVFVPEQSLLYPELCPEWFLSTPLSEPELAQGTTPEYQVLFPILFRNQANAGYLEHSHLFEPSSIHFRSPLIKGPSRAEFVSLRSYRITSLCMVSLHIIRSAEFNSRSIVDDKTKR